MIVSNASTIILLAKVSLLRKFLEEYGQIHIPPEVFKEVTGGETFDAKLLKTEIQKNRIRVQNMSLDTKTLRKEFRLHRGEAQSYALFQELKARVLLTDDGELIKLCRLFEIPFVNALALVTRLLEKNVISKKEACEYLKMLYIRGRYSEEVYEYFRGEVDC